MKKVDPLFKKVDMNDKSFNCNCVCNVEHDLHSDGKSWTWLPWNSCGCACYGSENRTANNNEAKG